MRIIKNFDSSVKKKKGDVRKKLEQEKATREELLKKENVFEIEEDVDIGLDENGAHIILEKDDVIEVIPKKEAKKKKEQDDPEDDMEKEDEEMDDKDKEKDKEKEASKKK